MSKNIQDRSIAEDMIIENLKIRYRIKSIYGEDRLYVVDKNMSKNIQDLTGRKTLSHLDMVALTNMGFIFEQVI